jgi:hypothetical protein
LSVTDGAVQVATAVHSPGSVFFVMFAGQPVITGASLSAIVTVNAQVVVLPDVSTAEYVTAVVPFGNVSPGLCEGVHEAMPQLSVAAGATHVTTALHLPGSVL